LNIAQRKIWQPWNKMHMLIYDGGIVGSIVKSIVGLSWFCGFVCLVENNRGRV
jgi:hypothetical protein